MRLCRLQTGEEKAGRRKGASKTPSLLPPLLSQLLRKCLWDLDTPWDRI